MVGIRIRVPEVSSHGKPCRKAKRTPIRPNLQKVRNILPTRIIDYPLIRVMNLRLPQIQREIERSILRTREALEDLPKAPSSDPVSEIANMLHGFVRDLARHVEGVPDEDGLLQSIRPAQTTFRRAVRATAPEFMPFEKRYAGLKNIEKAEFLANEDEADDLLVGDFGEESDSEEEEEDDGRLRFDFRPRVRPGIAVEKRIWIDEVFNRAHQ